MTVLSLLNPFGWFGSGGPAKLSGGNQPSSGGIGSYSGKPVTPERALELAAYWACVKIIAQTIGTLSCRLYNQAPDGSRTPAVDNPLYDILLHQPNADHSAVEFWEGVGASLAIWGNAFALKGIVGNRIVSLDLLRPYLITATRDELGEPIYRYADPVLGIQKFGADDLLVIRGFGLCDLTGFSPIQFARQTIGSAIAADEAAGSLFRNSMRMSGWFKYKGGNGVLNQEQQKDTRAALIAPNIGSENAGKVGLLPGDFDWVSTAINPDDAQLIENRRMGVEEICRFFGVPPILVGHSAQGQTMWGTGVDSIVLGFMTTGLRPYLKRIEAAISRDVIGRAARQTLVVAFDVTELLRGDNKGQAEIDQSLANTGIKTRNEIRAERNMPPKPGGDTLTVQSALLPIEMLGKVASLPADKSVDPGADVVAESEAKRIGGAVAAAMKYSEDQARDPRGRFAAGGGGGADGSAKPLSTREKVILGVGAVGALALGAALHRRVPYKAHGSSILDARYKDHDLKVALKDLHKRSVHTPLTEAERKSLVKYTGNDFRVINRKLRLGHKPTADVDNIDSALQKSSLAENTVVYRGVNLDRSKRLLSKYAPGDVFVDKGYPSTSLSEGVARDFATNKDGAGSGHVSDPSKRGYVWSINVDKGASALPLTPGHTYHDNLVEMLLPRSSAFKMLSVDHGSKTVYMQHVHLGDDVLSKSRGSENDPFGNEDGDAGDRFLVGMDDDLDWYEAPEGDTTAEDYAGYRPPQPDDGNRKAFDPSEDRDGRGEWTAGGASGGGSSGDWQAAKDASFAIAKGVAITAAVGLATALAPETFAVAAGGAVVEGSLAVVTKAAEYAAETALYDAAFTSGKVILKHLGLDTAKAEDKLKSFIGLAPAKSAGSNVDVQLKTGLRAVADHTKSEMVSHLGRYRIAPDKLKAASAAIDVACTKFKAKLA